MVDAWLARGLEGFHVWKFALQRLEGQPPLQEAPAAESEGEGEEAQQEEEQGGAKA